MRRRLANVADVDHQGLCTECGSCEGLCPFRNVRLEQSAEGRYRVRILDACHCENCPRICLQICPGHEVNVDALNHQVFGGLPRDYMMGHYSACYLGGISDPILRERVTSGGMASGLTAFAIESGRARGAYVVRDVPDKPFAPRIDLATDREGIRAAAGSKYWPAPLGRCLGDILRSKERLVFVGLPCEITAMRKAQKVYPSLSERIAFSVGLFCGRRATVQGQLFALEQMGFQPSAVATMRYREAPHPGHLVVYLRDGRAISVPRDKQLPGFAGHLFLHPRCLLCHDGLSELADISVGDGLGIKAQRQENENSVVIARTERGAEILEAAQSSGTIHIRPLDPSVLLDAKKRFLGDKRRSLWARIELARRIPGLSAPDIRLTRPAEARPRREDYVRGLMLLFSVRIVQKASIHSMLHRLPDHVLARYSTYGRVP